MGESIGQGVAFIFSLNWNSMYFYITLLGLVVY
jgi:hypothetical protein